MAARRRQFGHVGAMQAHRRGQPGALHGTPAGGDLARVVVHSEVGQGMSVRMQILSEQADAATDVEQRQRAARHECGDRGVDRIAGQLGPDVAALQAAVVQAGDALAGKTVHPAPVSWRWRLADLRWNVCRGVAMERGRFVAPWRLYYACSVIDAAGFVELPPAQETKAGPTGRPSRVAAVPVTGRSRRRRRTPPPHRCASSRSRRRHWPRRRRRS